ncbi:methyltransferase domain-containing protein [Streptomyces sp. A7024]|uniref:Methyltransferase domain-containing protein n=1 Tax=Streptomyces coryli TaxID=1128680 RepID=A0A6G4TXV7_9ACTN|nr:class I SAM-dependent methyltransferase [Streptomyces coryli]NGN63948.1 methyltransferase domain-containing protein [Streptomyces coryli]
MRAGQDHQAREHYGDRIFHGGTAGELARLEALAAAFDPASRRWLAALGVGHGWRCLDVGAGPGSLTRWLAGQVGEDGEVVAVDRDTRFLERISHPRLRVVQADLTVEDPPLPGGYDLVHARFVLMHLREREELLDRLVSYLRPGGFLLVSDAADLASQSSPDHAFRRTMTGMWQALAATIGTDGQWGRQYPAALARRGLRVLGMAAELPVVSAASPLGVFWGLTFRECRAAISAHTDVRDETVDRALEYLGEPDTRDLSMAMIGGWGRRPG